MMHVRTPFGPIPAPALLLGLSTACPGVGEPVDDLVGRWATADEVELLDDQTVSWRVELDVRADDTVTVASRGTVATASLASTEIDARSGTREGTGGDPGVLSFAAQDVWSGFAPALVLACTLVHSDHLVCEGEDGESLDFFRVEETPTPDVWTLSEQTFSGETTGFPRQETQEHEGRAYLVTSSATLELAGDGRFVETFIEAWAGPSDSHTELLSLVGGWQDTADGPVLDHEDPMYDERCLRADDVLTCSDPALPQDSEIWRR